MSRYSQKIFWIVVSFLFAGFLWASIKQLNADQVSEEMESTVTESRLKDGTVDTYDDFGNLKTRVNYENGYKHGISYLFYKNGQVQLAMPYRRGDREGISRKYYESGKIYAETPYRDDKLTGSRVLFYRNGNKKAEIPYFNSWPGIGLKEYLKSGEQKILNAKVKYSISNEELILYSPEGCDKSVAFYVTDLFDGQFLNVKDPELIRLASEDGKGYINLAVYTPSYLNMRDVVCQCKTKQGNEWVIRVELSL